MSNRRLASEIATALVRWPACPPLALDIVRHSDLFEDIPVRNALLVHPDVPLAAQLLDDLAEWDLDDLLVPTTPEARVRDLVAGVPATVLADYLREYAKAHPLAVARACQEGVEDPELAWAVMTHVAGPTHAAMVDSAAARLHPPEKVTPQWLVHWLAEAVAHPDLLAGWASTVPQVARPALTWLAQQHAAGRDVAQALANELTEVPGTGRMPWWMAMPRPWASRQSDPADAWSDLIDATGSQTLAQRAVAVMAESKPRGEPHVWHVVADAIAAHPRLSGSGVHVAAECTARGLPLPAPDQPTDVALADARLAGAQGPAGVLDALEDGPLTGERLAAGVERLTTAVTWSTKLPAGRAGSVALAAAQLACGGDPATWAWQQGTELARSLAAVHLLPGPATAGVAAMIDFAERKAAGLGLGGCSTRVAVRWAWRDALLCGALIDWLASLPVTWTATFVHTLLDVAADFEGTFDELAQVATALAA